MRIVVLGGTRFIGRAIVEELAGAGHHLLVVHRGALEPEGLPAAKHLHVDRAALPAHASELAAFKPDAAIDCRALTRVDAEAALAALPREGQNDTATLPRRGAFVRSWNSYSRRYQDTVVESSSDVR